MTLPKDHAAKVRDEARLLWAEEMSRLFKPYAPESEKSILGKQPFDAGFDAGFKYQQEKVEELKNLIRTAIDIREGKITSAGGKMNWMKSAKEMVG